LSLDPIRPYTDLQINPWEDTNFFEATDTGNITTVPVFTGVYEYEFNFLYGFVNDSNGLLRVSVGAVADNKYLCYMQGNTILTNVQSRLVMSAIENPVPIVATIGPGSVAALLVGNWRRRELRRI